MAEQEGPPQTPAEMMVAIEREVARGTHPLIARFVATAQEYEVIGLKSDPSLQKLVAVWSLVPVAWVPPTRIPEDATAPQLWRLMWSTALVDVEALAEGMGCEDDHATRKLYQAKAARLIFPDGRIHRYAARAIKARVASMFPKAMFAKAGKRKAS